MLSNQLSYTKVKDITDLNKLVRKIKSEPEICLTFKALDLCSLKLHVYSDASYGNLPNNGSQCGYIIFLTDEHDNVFNPLIWKSVKLDRICQSALAAEALSLVKAVDHAVFIQQTLLDIIGVNSVPIKCVIDSKSLYEILTKTKDPQEKRLIVILAPIRESIERNEIEVCRILSKQMPADILTKRRGVNPAVIRDHLIN